MAEIIETRNLIIKDRIIKLSDIRRLASLVLSKHDDTLASEKSSRLRFSVSCFDNSQFDSSDIAIFNDDSIVSNKRVSRVSIRYSSYDSGEEIDIELSHGESEYRNYVKISGPDSTWVNGTLANIEESLSVISPQNTFLSSYKLIINIIFAISIGSIYFYLLDLIPIPVKPPERETPEWIVSLRELIEKIGIFVYFLKYIIAFAVGIWPGYMLWDKLTTLWPSIEFQIGPEHTFIEQRRRLWLSTAFMFGFLPLAVSVIYDIIKICFTVGG